MLTIKQWISLDLVTWKSLKSLGNWWTWIGILQLNDYHVFVVNGNKSNYCSISWFINLKTFFAHVLDRGMLFHILQIKLITNRWAWGRCPWRQVVVSRKITSLNPGAPILTATQRAQTTTRQHHTEKLSGNTCKPLYSQNADKQGGKGEGQLATQKQDLLFYNLTDNLIASIAYSLHSLFYLIVKFDHIPLKKKPFTLSF